MWNNSTNIPRVQDISHGNELVSRWQKAQTDQTVKAVRHRYRLFLLSLLGSLRHRASFEHIENFCMFIGYPRSGHTLIGSILDAHPNAIIADEINVLRYFDNGFRKSQLFYLLLRNSLRAAAAGRKRTGYVYQVPGQWQGRYEQLQVIGDKMGHAAAPRLAADPELLGRLRQFLKVNIKFVHVLRNPYDIISTMTLRHKVPLKQSINRFFWLCQCVDAIKRQVPPDHICDLKHEDFIRSPKTNLEYLCDFFHLKTDGSYLDASAKIVFASPHKSRFEAQWDKTLVDSVRIKMSKFNFLYEYSYED
jgi:hypothetical protein